MYQFLKEWDEACAYARECILPPDIYAHLTWPVILAILGNAIVIGLIFNTKKNFMK